MGVPLNPPPVPDCIPVFIASDSQGKFGGQCPSCGGYWRSATTLVICPYCAASGERHRFLTACPNAVTFCKYCQRLREAISDEKDGDHVIDMDAVADAAGKDIEKPPFYYSEEVSKTSFPATPAAPTTTSSENSATAQPAARATTSTSCKAPPCLKSETA